MQAMTWITQMDKDCVFNFLTPIDFVDVVIKVNSLYLNQNPEKNSNGNISL